jgi:hypothetical protein
LTKQLNSFSDLQIGLQNWGGKTLMTSAHKFLILAGMPCSGKSTLLRESLQSNASLFGEMHDDIFQKTNIPPESFENTLSLNDRISANFWIHEWDLVRARKQGLTLDSNVIHFDMYWFCISLLQDMFRGTAYLKNLDNLKTITNDPAMLVSLFRQVNKLLPQDAIIVGKKIILEYSEACARWKKRCAIHGGLYFEEQAFLHECIYNESKEGESIYFCFIDAFSDCFENKN